MKAANMHNCGIKKPQECIKGFTNYTMKWKFKQVKTFSLKYMNKDQIAEEFSCCLLAMIRWGEWWVQILLSYYQLYGTNNYLLNIADGYKKRYLIANYSSKDSSNDNSPLNGA